MGGGTNAWIAEIRWRWLVKAEKFVETEREGGRLCYRGANEGVEWVEVM